ncbi:MAG: germination protein YpeB [Clostridia bacterium]|nr:germination protein YpeB [Clostridia bacterium]
MKHRYIYWTLTAVIVASVIFAGYEYSKAEKLETMQNNTYNRSFFELSGYVDDINTLLSKSLLVNSPEHFASISAELSRQSAAAKECLSQLPLSDTSLEKTEKFLSQVGDYSFYLSRNALYDSKMTEEEYETLSTLSTYAESLSDSLNAIQTDIYNGTFSFGREKRTNSNTAYADDFDGFSRIEKEFGEYPSLIYDGPFSEHIESMKPKLLEGAEELTAEKAAMIANEFLGKKSGFISFENESSNSVIETYTFTAKDKQKTVSITKKGGHILYYMDTREIKESSIDENTAVAKAQEFLISHGFKNMEERYYEKTENFLTVNFAYKTGDVTCYPDLIKIKVALDNGDIIGMESYGYIMNHTERTLPSPKLSKQEARSYVSPHLNIDSSKLTLIPKDSLQEVLCYEFHGTSNGKNFLIYINAENGREEEILILIESENGTLTV